METTGRLWWKRWRQLQVTTRNFLNLDILLRIFIFFLILSFLFLLFRNWIFHMASRECCTRVLLYWCRLACYYALFDENLSADEYSWEQCNFNLIYSNVEYKKGKIVGTETTVSGFRPHTWYKMTVEARNGVSSLFPDPQHINDFVFLTEESGKKLVRKWNWIARIKRG